MSLTSGTKETPTPSGSPLEVSEFPIQDRPTRSKLLSFFSRRKSDKTGKDSNTSTIPIPIPPEPTEDVAQKQQTGSHRVIASRSRSITWSSRNSKQPSTSSRNVKPVRPRALTTWDPPPLFQAYTQAVMHAVLDVPSSFSDLLFRNNQIRRTSTSSEASSIVKYQEVSGQSKTTGEAKPAHDSFDAKHKRNLSSSGSGNCALTEKLFVLVTSGYILQYNAEGYPDRLPEKILELGPNSVAIASDALPGRHWVLRISHNGKADQIQTQTPPKNSWSRLPFRSAEQKRLVKDFLLVFGSAKSFDAWLTSVRKEIEALGGLEYQPDLKGLDSEPRRRRPTHRLQAQKETLPFSKSGSHLPLTPYEQGLGQSSPDWHESFLPSTIAPFRGAKSTPGSSIGTVTDLDKLRDSGYSENRSSATGTRGSVDTSTASGSPGYDNFPANLMYKHNNEQRAKAMLGPNKIMPRRLSVTEQSAQQKADARKSSLVDPSLLWSLQFPRSADDVDVKNNTESNMQDSERKGSASSYSKSRPISTIAPLPTPATLKKTISRYRRDSSNSVDQPLVSPPVGRPMSSHSSSGSRDSTGYDAATSRRTPSYSLFPKRNSSLGHAAKFSGSSFLPSPPLTSPAIPEPFSATNEGFPFPNISPLPHESFKESHVLPDSNHLQRPGSRMGHHKNRSNNNSSDQMNFSFDDFNKPKRSPAVTEAHLSTLFGIQDMKLNAEGRERSRTIGNSSQSETKLAKPSLPATRSEPITSSSSKITTTTIEVPSVFSSTSKHSAYPPSIAVPVLDLPPPSRKDRQNHTHKRSQGSQGLTHRGISSQKSLPNLSSLASLQLQNQPSPPLPLQQTSGPIYSAGPPIGPPPSGPLPAVPLEVNQIPPQQQTGQQHNRSKSSVSSNTSSISNLNLNLSVSSTNTPIPLPLSLSGTNAVGDRYSPQRHYRNPSSSNSPQRSYPQQHHQNSSSSSPSQSKPAKPALPGQGQGQGHTRKLSSVSSVSSLGSLSAWVSNATITPTHHHHQAHPISCPSPASTTTSDIVPNLTVAFTPSPAGLTPVTPTFPLGSATVETMPGDLDDEDDDGRIADPRTIAAIAKKRGVRDDVGEARGFPFEISERRIF